MWFNYPVYWWSANVLSSDSWDMFWDLFRLQNSLTLDSTCYLWCHSLFVFLFRICTQGWIYYFQLGPNNLSQICFDRQIRNLDSSFTQNVQLYVLRKLALSAVMIDKVSFKKKCGHIPRAEFKRENDLLICSLITLLRFCIPIQKTYERVWIQDNLNYHAIKIPLIIVKGKQNILSKNILSTNQFHSTAK